ncbi:MULTISPECIES: DUF2267 domain-containing protein [unclassified Streptomyces]|uniref:DUF2267 domain-containing protein n=1 Tax=unclassified Streptomyces TaxID=2593676 RepID=UPI003D72EE84
MISHEQLVEDVSTRARLDDTEAADAAVHLVLAALSRRLDDRRREHLRQAVPAHEHVALVAGGGSGRGQANRLTDLLAEVAGPAGGTPEQALFLSQTVLSRVTDEDSGLEADLRGCLPDEFGPLFAAPGTQPQRSGRARPAPPPR